MRGRKKLVEAHVEAFLSDACPLIRRFYKKVAEAAMGRPILDIPCGSGRNAFPLAALGCTVICADNDLTRLHSPNRLASRLIPQQLDLIADAWPFKRASAGGIVNVHFLLLPLFLHFENSLARGSYLLLETVPGRGGNYLQLPKAGELRSLLKGSFELEFYKEIKTGPQGCDAVAVRLLARRL